MLATQADPELAGHRHLDATEPWQRSHWHDQAAGVR
jgi:hypothetical protein